jgi:TolB protein
MAHRFSDHVFQAFTGVEGPFDTQVVCATPRRQGKDIVIMDYDGYNTRTLVSDGALNLAPVLSPDGALLAYTSYRAGAPNLYLRHLAGGQDEKLTSGTGLALAGSWSPDGRYLALNQTVEGNSDIFLYDLKQKRFTRLTTDWGIDVSPSFAPDGRRLVFTSDRGGSPQLYITDIHGGSEARLTYEGKYNTAPAWGPLDDTIAFVGRSERRELVVYTMHTNGQRLQRLTEGGSNSESPTWAPNGHFMMYISMEGNTWRRYIVREDGQGKAVPATVGPVCLAPQWVGRKGP